MVYTLGPGTSFEFSLCLVEQFFGESVAKEVGELLVSPIMNVVVL